MDTVEDDLKNRTAGQAFAMGPRTSPDVAPQDDKDSDA